VAVLTAAMAVEPRNWTDGEVALIESVATRTKLAIEAAQSQEREHRIATGLQKALVPDLPTAIPGLAVASYMCPALDEASVGGDFCDVFQLNVGRYGIVIGDVSGKGLAAAAQSSVVRNMLHCLLVEHCDVARAVATLNRIVTANQLLRGFVTVFVGLYDAESGRVTYISCGHEPGLIRRANSQRVSTLQYGDVPLGIDEAATFQENEVILRSGDILLFYTDGLTEAGPNRTELLGIDGLATLFEQVSLDAGLTKAFDSLLVDVAAYAQFGFRDDVYAIMAWRR